MPELEQMTPLHLIKVKCAECDSEATAAEVNEDKLRFHHTNGNMVWFPTAGLLPDQMKNLESMKLLCECCYEELTDL